MPIPDNPSSTARLLEEMQEPAPQIQVLPVGEDRFCDGPGALPAGQVLTALFRHPQSGEFLPVTVAFYQYAPGFRDQNFGLAVYFCDDSGVIRRGVSLRWDDGPENPPAVISWQPPVEVPAAAAEFTLNEPAARELAEQYPFELDDRDEWEDTAYLLIEAAISDGPITGPAGIDLAVDRLADGNGDLDGYAILVGAVWDYWLRSPIIRVNTAAAPPRGTEILQDAVKKANNMLTAFRGAAGQFTGKA